ncbi:MAG TPA: aminoglycoside phosphotransferase family protein [Longimicrobiales bacterium]|nr:aminoglycoside phosphotransferase family protein [Longimicrobiales bacterium]
MESPSSRRPAAEVAVDVTLAQTLLEEQHPRFLPAPLEPVDEGWDNFVFRLGAEHALRLPRRAAAVEPLLNEERWLPELAPRLGLRVPLPVAAGLPGPRFAWPWSVVEWIEGSTAERARLGAREARTLAAALRALHVPAHPHAPKNPFRGVPLEVRREALEAHLATLDVPALWHAWRSALEAPPCSVPVWIHGDLHPKNVLVRGGAIVGLIDWGDLAAGDPATDLACAWTLFDARARAAFLEAYAPAEAELRRGLGWALVLGTALATSGDARHARMGRRVLERVARDRA